MKSQNISIIIILVITTIVISGFSYYEISENQCIDGLDRIVYRNCLQGYEITIKNSNWEVKENLELNDPIIEQYFPNTSIIEGIIIQKNIKDTINPKVLIIIYDDSNDLDLQKYYEAYLEFHSDTGLAELITSYNENIENELNLKTQTGDPLYHISNDRLIKNQDKIFQIHSQSRVNESSKITQNEMNAIYDSFKFLEK